MPPLSTAIAVADQVPLVMLPTPASEDKLVTALFTNVPLVGSVTLVAPVLVKVMEFAPLVASVELLASVNVPLVVEVMVSPFIVVAVAAPNVGVVNDGEVANTKAPDPVSSLITPASWADVVAAKTDKLLDV